MIKMTKHYIIIDLADVTQDMIDDCIETSLDTLRISLNGIETILKWNGETPTSILALDPQPTQYTNAEIKVILNDPENGWIEEV